MLTSQWAQTLANYNRSMNERLYECCAQVPDVERKRDVGAFFKSVHGTLNHLLVGDRIWLGRFLSQPFAVASLATELYADFAMLRAERSRTDAAIVDWSQSLTEVVLNGKLNYTSMTGGKRFSYPLWFAVTHFFNHQTHHRGQLTTLLSQQGLDPGVTDLITFPIVANP